MDTSSLFNGLLGDSFLGNSWERWLIASAIFLGLLTITWSVKAFLVSRLRVLSVKTETKWDDLALQLLERTTFFFLFLISFYIATQSLSLHEKVAQGSRLAFFLVLFLQVGFWANHGITFFGNTYAERTLATDAARATTVRALLVFGKITVWIIIALLLLDNWGIKVAPFIAGLGVGGVAIALAVQNILGDLFASLSIVLDKPFVIGDFIAVDTEAGTVEYIGLKTTRLKSISGEQLVFSNSDLLKSRIRNYKRMWERRVVFTFGVVYETPPEKLHRVREIVKEIFQSVDGVRMDRCFFQKFGNSSLDFEVVYWVNSPEFNYYAERHHGISVKLLETFNKEGIEFAYPTQVLHIDGKLSHENGPVPRS